MLERWVNLNEREREREREREGTRKRGQEKMRDFISLIIQGILELC
jgi:hypothetical protein